MAREWEKTFDRIISVGDFNGISPMVVDMMAKYNSDWKMKKFSHPYPVLEIRGGRCYTTQEIVSAVRWLVKNGIHSFIVAERSTATLELIYNLLCLNNGEGSKLLYGENSSYKISISQNYYQNVVHPEWNTRESLWGILVKITRRHFIYNY